MSYIIQVCDIHSIFQKIVLSTIESLLNLPKLCILSAELQLVAEQILKIEVFMMHCLYNMAICFGGNESLEEDLSLEPNFFWEGEYRYYLLVNQKVEKMAQTNRYLSLETGVAPKFISD